jgi:hypothetical protein
MRRPPIACQRAVQSLQSPAPQHVWVPDDVLSLAVHRFFRTTCPSQKRHGSNVPGPLEARRRAAKRRMTASAGAFPQDGLPTSFSLSALFGYRSAPQNAWRYEPPSLPRNPWPLDTRTLCIRSMSFTNTNCNSSITMGLFTILQSSTAKPGHRFEAIRIYRTAVLCATSCTGANTRN